MTTRAVHLAQLMVLALAAGLAGGYLLNTLWRLSHHVMDPASYSRTDFFAIWSYARLLLDQGAAAVYDQPRLFAAQIALGRDPAGVPPLPFAYPPNFLLLIWPLGLLAHGPAFGTWIAVTLGLYLSAVAWGMKRAGWIALAALALPASSVVISFGQSGFLAGALLVGGLRLAPARPILGGILLGLLTYKPQLGLLVPVALVAAGMWRCVASACLTTLALIVLSSLVFGLDIWMTWLAVLPEYARSFDETRAGILHYMPTVTASLIGLGASAGTVLAGQGAVALVVAGTVWTSYRRAPTDQAHCVLLAGTLLMSGHAFIYDIPATSAGLLLFAWLAWPMGLTRGLVLLLALVWPVLLFEQVVPLALNGLPGVIAFITIATAVARNPRPLQQQ